MLWKVYSVVVNCRLKRSVVLQNSLHGFREGRATQTATLEVNLEQQLVGIVHYAYVQKVYDSLYRERCLEILRGYRMGTNQARLLVLSGPAHPNRQK